MKGFTASTSATYTGVGPEFLSGGWGTGAAEPWGYT